MDKTQLASFKKLSNNLRILSADMVENANSGHPGLPLGFADVFSVLVSNHLRFNNKNPEWVARDRLVLSAGHGSALLYSFLHFARFEGYDMDEIKNFRQIDSNTPGHPEFSKKHAIETTTGPLGQGFATSVGMAIAQKKYARKLGDSLNYRVYCIVGDGCLMEGISTEAASLAGHLNLDNLVVLFDSNNISIDGDTSLSTSEDYIKKFRALGFETFKCDGHNYTSINDKLEHAKNSAKPVFIEFKTIIGKFAGSKENSEKSHGSPLGNENIELLRKNLDWKKEPFHFDEEDYSEWNNVNSHKQEIYNLWKNEFDSINSEDKKFLDKISTDKMLDILSQISLTNYKTESTRKSSGKVLELLQKTNEKIICGSADLSESNSILNFFSKPITKDDFSGNFIHFGIRENAMAAIMNGLQIENFKCFCSTFLVFSDYMRPSIRLSALMNLPITYILTHDSVALGEDGPTHQPVEHLSSLRAMPNIKIYRPADNQEVVDSYNKIIENNCPSILALTRQNIDQFSFSLNRREGIYKGAYIFDKDDGDIDISLWTSGSELQIAEGVKKYLNNANFKVSIISVPCFEDFYEQNKDYQDKLLNLGKLKVALEAGSRMSWDRVIGNDGMFFGVNNRFGISGKGNEIFEYLNLTAPYISNRIIKKLT